MTLRIIGAPRPAPSAIVARLFLRAMLMSLLQSAGIVALAYRSPVALITSFLISYLWIGNTRDSVDYRQPAVRFAYAAGGCCGAAITLGAVWLWG